MFVAGLITGFTIGALVTIICWIIWISRLQKAVQDQDALVVQQEQKIEDQERTIRRLNTQF